VVARLRKLAVGHLAVRVLDELQPIRREEVATFLGDLGTPPAVALHRASQLVATDNEYVLQHLHRLLETRTDA
jgi:hypothetical protein